PSSPALASPSCEGAALWPPRTGPMAASAAARAPRSLLLPWPLLLLILLAALLHPASPAAPEKEVPSRPLRVRVRSPLSAPDRSPVWWRLPHSSGSRSPRRYPAYLSRYGESSRKMSYKPLPKEERNPEIKKTDMRKTSGCIMTTSCPSFSHFIWYISYILVTDYCHGCLSEEEDLEEAKDITIRVMSSQSVLVTWTDPVYEKRRTVTARKYTVRYREKGESARWDYKKVSSRRVLVDKLIPDTMYEFAVQISEGEREGRWSASVYQRTPEAAPSSAPENLNVWPIKGQTPSVAASWDALPETEGKVKEYILSYAPALKPFGAKSISYPGETTSALVEGLQPGERYIFKIRAANRRGQGPQSKAFSVVLPGDELKVDQQINTEDSEPQPNSSSQDISQTSSSKHTSGHLSSVPGGRDSKSSISDLKNKLLAGNRNPTKKHLSSRKDIGEGDSHSTRDTAGHHASKEVATAQAKPQDTKSSLKSNSPVKPPHTDSSSSGKTPHSSQTPVSAGQTSTGRQRSLPSSSSSASTVIPKFRENETKHLRLDSSNLPSSPEVTLDNLPVDNESNDEVDSTGEKHTSHSNEQHSVPRKVVQRRPPKLPVPSVSVKSPTLPAVPSNAHHPSYKLVPADTSDSSEKLNGRDLLKREQKPSSRSQGGSSPSVQARPLFHSNRQAVRDPRVATSAVSAAATHTLPHSYRPPSTKHRPSGREDFDDKDNQSDEKEEGRENKRGLPSLRSSSRSSLGQTISERFDLLKHRSAVTANRLAHRASNTPDTSMQSPKGSSTAESSKVHPQSSSHLTTGRSASERTSSSSRSVPRTSVEKSSLRSPASKYQPDDLESKNISPKPKEPSPLPKKTLIGGSHALSHKTVYPETSHHSQSQPSLNMRNQPTPPLQNNENVEDEDEGNLEGNPYKEANDMEKQKNFHSVPAKDISTHRRVSASLSRESTTALSKHSDSRTSKSGEKSPAQLEPLTSSRRLTSPPRQRIGLKVITSSEDMFDIYKLPSSSHQSKYVEPESPFPKETVKDHQNSRETVLFSKASSTSLRQTHPSSSHYPSVSRGPSRTASQTGKKYGLLEPTSTKTEHPPKPPSSKTRLTLPRHDDNQSETVENPAASLAERWPSSSISRGSKNLSNKTGREKNKSPSTALTHKGKIVDEEEYKQEEEEEEEAEEDEEGKYITSKASNTALSGKSVSTSMSSESSNKPHTSRSSGYTSVSSQIHPTHAASPTTSSTSSVFPNQRIQNSRLFNLSQRQQSRLPHRQGNGGRPNLTTKPDQNNKIYLGNNGRRHGQKVINGPQGTKWIVDLDRGLVLNVEGRYLQDSEGKPLRVKLGGDGRTIVDSKGAPIVSPEGLPLFGHGRFSKPVANAQDKPIISLGGKPLIGLEMIKRTTTPSTTTMTTTSTTTTTTTIATTTTPEPTTTEPPTEKPLPTCPPGSYPEYDEAGNLVLGRNGHPECNSEDIFSGLDADVAGTTESYVLYDEDYEFFETTLPPTTTVTTTVTSATTTTEVLPETTFPEFSMTGSDPLSEYDAAGKKRFTAPYVTYLNKDPGAPCSLTEALDHFQVESLDEIIPSDLKNKQMGPRNVPHNITVVAVEGCHSFVILDWAKPVRGDLVTGYLVYSASYDDFIRNRWSTKTAGSTNLPIENLKPNTRYYFKIQAKNPYGYGPMSSSISYVTESDNPLLIVRPPGGEPIWIPFSFKYDPTYSECSGKQYVKRTWYRKFVGVVLCNSLRYKIYLSDDLRGTFYSIGDSWGRGEDHCQFVDSHLDGRTGPQSYVEALPPIPGYYRQYRQEPVSFGRIGYLTPYYYVGWYECGVPIPGKW
ncbi:hypothetical protein JRQ81_009209, partial [Phrynocephalus forsythii]